MSNWNVIANCAKMSKMAKGPRSKKKHRRKAIAVPGFRDRMLKYLENQGVSFAKEPTNEFLAKMCAEKLDMTFNVASLDGIKEILVRLPDFSKAKKAIKKKRVNFYATREWRELRYRVLKESNGKCALCARGARDDMPLHVDHIMPRSKYPKLALEITNLQVLCEDCNLGKSNKDNTDWRK